MRPETYVRQGVTTSTVLTIIPYKNETTPDQILKKKMYLPGSYEFEYKIFNPEQTKLDTQILCQKPITDYVRMYIFHLCLYPTQVYRFFKILHDQNGL